MGYHRLAAPGADWHDYCGGSIRGDLVTIIRMNEQMDLNGDGRVSAWELFVSTGMIILYVFLALASVVGSVALLFLDVWPVCKGVALLLTVAFGVGAWTGIRRQHIFERAEASQAGREALERERSRLELDMLKGADEPATESGLTQSKVDRYARMYLNLYYEKGQLSRSEWVRGGLSKDAWDHVNGIMKSSGIRRGKSSKLEPDSFADAWGEWVDYHARSHSWIKSGDDLLSV